MAQTAKMGFLKKRTCLYNQLCSGKTSILACLGSAFLLSSSGVFYLFPHSIVARLCTFQLFSGLPEILLKPALVLSFNKDHRVALVQMRLFGSFPVPNHISLTFPVIISH